MRKDCLEVYVCPGCAGRLGVEDEERSGGGIQQGRLRCGSGHVFPLSAGVPDLTYPCELAPADRKARDEYDAMADKYDVYAPLPFMTYGVDEWVTREKMVDDLRLEAGSRVLEIGCGTGRTSKILAQRLTAGRLFLQELAPKILGKAIDALSAFGNIDFAVANGSYLSFRDRYFDAAHHFGGLNTFSDIKRCLAELARVTRIGGRVVVGDEGMGAWLRETEFGRIMMNSNPLLRCQPPLDELPVCARDVTVEWIVKGAFYTISFSVGEGAPEADYSLQIPSERGGSHWTRYHGNLEGVTDEAKRLAHLARRKAGKSMHQWLDDTVRQAALRDLGGDPT